MKKLSIILALIVLTLSITGCMGEDVEKMSVEEIKKELIEFQDPNEELSNYINAYVGEKATDITVSINGSEEEESLLEVIKEREGSIVEFMAPWCPSCIELIPELEELQKLTNKKVISLAVFTDTQKEIDEIVKQTNSELDYFLAKSDEGIDDYGLQYVPTIFYISKDGIIEGIFSQSTDMNEIKEFIEKIS